MDGGELPLRQGEADLYIGQVLHPLREEDLLGDAVVGGVKAPVPVQPLVQGGGADAAHLSPGQVCPGKLPYLEDLAEEVLRRRPREVLPHHAVYAPVNAVMVDSHICRRHGDVFGGAGAAGGDGEVDRFLRRQLAGAAGEQGLDVGRVVLVTGEGDLPLKVGQGADMGKAIARPVFRCGILPQDGLQLLPLDLPGAGCGPPQPGHGRRARRNIVRLHGLSSCPSEKKLDRLRIRRWTGCPQNL